MLFEDNLHEVVWGGHRLQPWKGSIAKDNEGQCAPIGESWEVSAVKSSPSIVANGMWKGMSLPEVISRMPNQILGGSVARRYNGRLPLLVKFIDADKDLSIQVHPDDAMAQREHGKMGKTEMWYVIDAKPGAHLYAGFKEELTAEEYASHVADGTIVDYLARHDVQAGDVFYLPAGRVHAICSGLLLAEVQQSSDVTYRIFDYNRPGLDGKPRQLHTELAAKALDYTVYEEYRTDYKDHRDSANRCIDSEFFSVRVVDINSTFHRNLKKYSSFVISMCISGYCRIRIRETGDEILLQEGHSCLIPAAIADYDVIPVDSEEKVQLLDAYIDNRDRSIIGRMSRILHLRSK